MAGKLKVTISPIGLPIIEAEGFTGQSCMEATRNIEAALSNPDGRTVVKKPEFDMVEEEGVETQQTQRW